MYGARPVSGWIKSSYRDAITLRMSVISKVSHSTALMRKAGHMLREFSNKTRRFAGIIIPTSGSAIMFVNRKY